MFFQVLLKPSPLFGLTKAGTDWLPLPPESSGFLAGPAAADKPPVKVMRLLLAPGLLPPLSTHSLLEFQAAGKSSDYPEALILRTSLEKTMWRNQKKP